ELAQVKLLAKLKGLKVTESEAIGDTSKVLARDIVSQLIMDKNVVLDERFAMLCQSLTELMALNKGIDLHLDNDKMFIISTNLRMNGQPELTTNFVQTWAETTSFTQAYGQWTLLLEERQQKDQARLVAKKWLQCAERGGESLYTAASLA